MLGAPTSQMGEEFLERASLARICANIVSMATSEKCTTEPAVVEKSISESAALIRSCTASGTASGSVAKEQILKELETGAEAFISIAFAGCVSPTMLNNLVSRGELHSSERLIYLSMVANSTGRVREAKLIAAFDRVITDTAVELCSVDLWRLKRPADWPGAQCRCDTLQWEIGRHESILRAKLATIGRERGGAIVAEAQSFGIDLFGKEPLSPAQRLETIKHLIAKADSA